MKTIKTFALTGALIAAPALAFANVAMGDKLGTDEDTIRAVLEQQGFTVQEYSTAGGQIEVEVMKDGVETDIILSQADGVVVGLETGRN